MASGGYKAAPGKAALLVVLLAVAAHVAAADDDQAYPWKCFRSCAKACHEDDASAAAMDDGASGHSAWYGNFSAAVSGDDDGGECKSGCHNDACFADVPAIGYPQCVYTACLSFPRRKREEKVCLKYCCEKCFRHGPPAPAPEPPSPSPPPPGPTPEPPSPTPPGPTPEPPSPPN